MVTQKTKRALSSASARAIRSRMADLRDELAASMGPIEMSDLRTHITRDAVIVIDAALDLLTVAEAVAKDDKALVSEWISKALIGKPTLEALARWEKTPAPRLVSVVVQPFVLVREEQQPSSPTN